MPRTPPASTVVGLLCLTLCWTTSALGNDHFYKQPVLRLNTESHFQHVRRIDTDSSDRFLVTASADKTVRLWSLPDFIPLAVLRPPIGAGRIGDMQSVAISPDGSLIAAGGVTHAPHEDNSDVWRIFIFNRSTGELVNVLSDLPHRARDIAFSDNGKYVGAGFHKHGIAIWRTKDGSQVYVDRNFEGRSLGVDFSSIGQFAATDLGGYVRSYLFHGEDAEGRLLAKKIVIKASKGKLPAGISFSPNGDKLAIGYGDVPYTSILSSKDLSEQLGPDDKTIDQLGASAIRQPMVAWSKNGQYLYTAGASDGVNHLVIQWRATDYSLTAKYSGARDTITDLAASHSQGFLFSAFGPVLGYGNGNRNSEISQHRHGNIFDLRGVEGHDLLRVSRDANAVAFSSRTNPDDIFFFDVKQLNLTRPDDWGEDLFGRTPLPVDVKVSPWVRGGACPDVSGFDIPCLPHERIVSLASSPDGKRLLIGTYYFIRVVDPTKGQIKEIAAPAAVERIRIVEDGKIAVIAYRDGTIRWHRVEDGEEILALFVDRNDLRWILWTPVGYYDASVGGEDLIGWHINQGAEELSIFYGASRFRDIYRRADIIQDVLTTISGGPEPSQESLQSKYLPVVTIYSPAQGETLKPGSVDIEYSVASPGNHRSVNVVFQIDARPREFRSVPTGKKLTQTLQISPGESIISLIAARPDGQFGESVERGLPTARSFVRVTPTKGQKAKGDLYALIVGVSDYKSDELNLRFAAKDAGDVRSLFGYQSGSIYHSVYERTVTNNSATKESIHDAFDWLTSSAKSNDTVFIFLAGHGMNQPREGEDSSSTFSGPYAFLPHNADLKNLSETAVLESEIAEVVRTLNSTVVVFLDTCHSGNLDIGRAIDVFSSSENGAIVFSAANKRQVAFENDQWNNGVFTWSLLNGFSGLADKQPPDNIITTSELWGWLTADVGKATNQRQIPTIRVPDAMPDIGLGKVVER